MQSRIEKLNYKIALSESVYSFDAEEFGEKEKYQLLSWVNNANKEDSFITINTLNEIYLLSYVNNKYHLALNGEIANSYQDFLYDVIVFDTRNESFIIYSSLLNAPTIEVISMSKWWYNNSVEYEYRGKPWNSKRF